MFFSLGTGCQKWKPLDTPGIQPPFSDTVVNRTFNRHEITQGPPTKWFIKECYYSTHLLFQCKYYLQSRQSAKYVMVILNKILHCTLKSQFEGTWKMISLGASDANEVSVLYTYLLSGGAGWVGIRLEVRVS